MITDNRVPVLKVVPYRPKLGPEEVFGDLRGKVKYRGDITEPESSAWKEE